MNTGTLLHLHPTLEMIAGELAQLGITCHCHGIRETEGFRAVGLYRGGEPERGMLYFLMPGDEASFPVDRAPYLCAGPVSGKAPHLTFPGQAAAAALGSVMELFARYQDWERKLDELVYRNAGLQELCEAGARMLENPICIHDDWFIMIAMSQELPRVMPPDYVMSSSKKFVPRAIVEDFKFDTDYLETYAHRTAQFWRSAPNTPACLYVNLWDGDVYQGRLLAVEHHRGFRSADYMMAEFLTQRAALLLQRQRLGGARSYRSMDDILFSLLQGEKTDPAEETQMLQMLGWNKSDKFTCIRIRSQQSSPTLVMEHVLHSDLFQAFPGSYIMFEGHQQCVVLNLTRQPTTLPRIRHALAPLCRDYCLYAGISSPVFGIRELHLAYYQADIALKQAFRQRDERWILPFSDCALDHILSSLQTPLQPLHIVAPELRLLRDYDREKGSQYFETLRVYLQQERDIPKTSEKLIIHRTTLLYRLKKIRELTELDMDDPNQRLYLMLSLWLLEKEETRKR